MKQGQPRMDIPMLADQQKFTLINFLQELGAVLMIFQVQWLIGTDGERESRKSEQSAWLDNDDDDTSLRISLFLLSVHINL